MSSILKNIREAEEAVRKATSLHQFMLPVRIFESTLLVEPGEEIELSLSWRERWLLPLMHPVTLPFEPWVKTRKVIPMVPMKKALVTRDGIFVHPAIAPVIRRQLEQAQKKLQGFDVARPNHLPSFLA